MDLGRVGVWCGQARAGGPEAAAPLAAAAESLGFGALWIPGGIGGDILERCERALESTTTLVVATGILNIWHHDPIEVAEAARRLDDRHGGRFLLGLGVSHGPLIGDDYVAPLEKMVSYLDALDAAGHPSSQRALAALRPKMLRLAAARSVGAHPYFVPPEHSVVARRTLGPGAWLMPEQAVLLETDPVAARATARAFCATYLRLPNYTNNLRDLGYSDADLDGTGSDRLVDAIVAWGSAEAVAERVGAHLAAGADHVCIQVIGSMDPIPAWRTLGPLLLPR